MIRNHISFEHALTVIDEAIKPSYLSRIHEIILQKSWEGKTYSEIAAEYNYEVDYIKSAGCELWKMLSKAFDKQIRKSNFAAFVRQQAWSSLQLVNQELDEVQALDSIIPKVHLGIPDTYNNLAIAPDVSTFQGRELELEELTSWTKDSSCRFILVSGMLGCGKTSLVAKLTEQISDQFDYCIWLSVDDSSSANDLIENCLKIFNPELVLNASTNSLLANLVSYLRQYRCLVVMDALDRVFQPGHIDTCYRDGYGAYAKLLSCIVTTQHQSLFVATSRVRPLQLQYYSSEQVRFLPLQGLEQVTISKIFQDRVANQISEDNWTTICQYYQHNPMLLNIVTNHLDYWSELTELKLQSIAEQFEEIDKLLELEINYLSDLDKEIVCWLAVNCPENKSEQLSRKTHQPRNKVVNRLNQLKERSLVVQSHDSYWLKPLLRNFLQRKLIQQAVQN